MPDYSKTVIYKIFCNDPTITETYVGHTISFIRRENEHKSRCNNQKSDKHNLQIYQTIRDHGGWENWTMVEIETFSCENEKEARKLVSEFVKKFGSTMNSKIPMRNKREYYEDNRENIDLYRKEYCKTNASVIKEKKFII